MAIIFSDDEFKNQYYGVNSFRMALWIVKDVHRIIGRVYCVHQRVSEHGTLTREYKLAGSDYRFTLSRGLKTSELAGEGWKHTIKEF